MLELLRLTFQSYEKAKARTEAKQLAESLVFRADQRKGLKRKPQETPQQQRQETKKFLAEALAMHCATSKMEKTLAKAEGAAASRKRAKKEPLTGAARTATALKRRQAAEARRLLKAQAAEADLLPASDGSEAEAKAAQVPPKRAAAAKKTKQTTKAKTAKKSAPTKRITRTCRAKPEAAAQRAGLGDCESEESRPSSANDSSVEDQPYDPANSAEEDTTTDESPSDADNAPLVAAADDNFSLDELARVGVVWAWGVLETSGAVTPTMAVVEKVQLGRSGRITHLRCQYLTPALEGVYVGQWKRCVDARTKKPFMCSIVSKRRGEVREDVVPAADVHCAVEWQWQGKGTEDWNQKCMMSEKEWAQLVELLKQD